MKRLVIQTKTFSDDLDVLIAGNKLLTQVASQGVSDEVAILFRIFKAIFRHTWVK
jgi:hypothetical protein